MSDITENMKKNLDRKANAKKTFKVTYKNANGEKKTMDVVYKEPSADVLTRVSDLGAGPNDTADIAGAAKLMIDSVIMHPKFSFADTDKLVKKHVNLRKKDLPATNADGDKVTIHMIWPGTANALQITGMMTRPSGALNLNSQLKALDKKVFRDDKEQPLDISFWDAGNKGHGLAAGAMGRAREFLNASLNANGLGAATNKVDTFLKEISSRVSI